MNIPDIKLIIDKDLIINHLLVVYNEDQDTLIYNRKLQNDSRISEYSIMVTQFLELPKIFIVKNLKSYNQSSLLTTKTSLYNKKVFVDRCKMCGVSTKELYTHIT